MPPSSPLPALPLPPLLRKFWIWIVSLTLLSMAYTLAMTYVRKATFPYGLPWFHDEPYVDFRVFGERFLHFRSAGFWQMKSYPVTYPAPIDVLFGLFYKLPHPMILYLSAFLCVLAAAGALFTRRLIAAGIAPWTAAGFTASVLVTSWPLAFLLNRANIEGVVIVLLAAGVLAVVRGRNLLGATLIGIAGSMKLFPLVLLALLLSKRRYKEFAWGLAVFAAVMLLSLKILGPDIVTAQHYISAGLAYFNATFATNVLPDWVGLDHSLFTLVKLTILGVQGLMHLGATFHQANGKHGGVVAASTPRLALALRVYLGFVSIGGLAAYLLWFRKLPLLNQLLALTICAVLLPPVSFDYTLLHLLLPFSLLCLYVVDAWRRRQEVPGLQVCMVCFALLFTAGMYFTLIIRLAGQVRVLALLALLVTCCRHRFPWAELDEVPVP